MMFLTPRILQKKRFEIIKRSLMIAFTLLNTCFKNNKVRQGYQHQNQLNLDLN